MVLFTGFASHYDNSDFMLQQKARVLIYFLFAAIMLLALILVSSNLLVESSLFSARNLMRVVLLVIAVIAFFLVKSGHYSIASNFILAFSTVAFSLQTYLEPFTSSPALLIRLMYLFIFVLVGAVFCSRIATMFTTAFLLVVFAAIIYRNSGLLGNNTRMLAVSFTATLLFISILALMILTIINNTLKKIAQDDVREKQHQELVKIVSTIRDVTLRLSELANNITKENESLSERTLEQASSIEEIAASMEQVSESIAGSSENSEQVKLLAVESTNAAQGGVDLIDQVFESIEDMEESSHKISEITTMINEISFNTNLLALNAAVEAARAGESGRGFAVVAAEVRNLAKRASDASRQIELLVKESIAAVSIGSQRVIKSGDSIKKIADMIKGVSAGINKIALTAVEQKGAVGQVNSAVMEIDNSIQCNSSLVEKNTGLGAEIVDLVNELKMLLSEIEE